MADGTPIEWTHRPGTRGETWNPVAGCGGSCACCDLSGAPCHADVLLELANRPTQRT